MKPTRTATSAAVFIAVALLSTSSIAVATPGSGTTAGPAVIGTIEGSQKTEQDQIEFKSKGDLAVLDFELTYAAGAYSGWHKHPGIVIATVKSGSVTRQLGCTTQTFVAGDTFTEVGPHFVSNPSTTTPAVLSITQIVPADQLNARRIDLPAPSC
ncbi:cupin domain-containing protein [Arthrobacter silvisoli]|uniref:cupin domain-containing protein n=1 Tax=Arthrobacter silvisoli TaxID=2291022 RepID=UPI000E218A37|nr:cupin domain-containing protein [Arthrobacter silvisoli]